LKGVEFLVSLNKRVLLGAVAGDPDSLTNDELFDVLTTPKTIKKGMYFPLIFVFFFLFFFILLL
jgi:hypothetical protein